MPLVAFVQGIPFGIHYRTPQVVVRKDERVGCHRLYLNSLNVIDCFHNTCCAIVHLILIDNISGESVPCHYEKLLYFAICPE